MFLKKAPEPIGDESLNVGDVVCLTSGGPPMTIIEIEDSGVTTMFIGTTVEVVDDIPPKALLKVVVKRDGYRTMDERGLVIHEAVLITT